ncbi:hypothetical protein MSG28_007301 [Choristoneura fumiferana]|uniref:Uncharacterized protein n=4 Tax=Choristoneura fumiferana TaxID=7141 RepID=A0ACC0JWV0_CHOFU|nr:hypothetical protein MSG28_007301 [Choristoneura fumiferana]KAI8428530.1 hypothetical protein MSG28_007301 [Choristoneura fumiferana]KAI8428531.1 hypothetical protein MSG28_007301 [Choristoneura fumiferana]
METQKILREIREKKNRSLDSSPRSPTEYGDVQHLFRDEPVLARKCVSPSILLGKERSRSNTPFFPMLDNIKETALDVSQKIKNSSINTEINERWQKTNIDDTDSHRDSKLTRPKSFPVKNLDQFDDQPQNAVSLTLSKEIESKDATLSRESKLIRPKSYPTSSPSPEKVYVSRNTKKDGSLRKPSLKEETPPPPLDTKNDVEVSFSISLPKKTKPVAPVKTENVNDANKDKEESVKDNQSTNLVLKKYVIVNKDSVDKPEMKDQKVENRLSVGNGNLNGNALKDESKEDTKVKVVTSASKKEITQKSSEVEGSEKKGTIKKKIIKKVSSKSKTDVGSQDADKKDGKPATEKKKVTKKVKEKESENGAKPTVTKKKSVLQSIGHKLEKFASSKSNSPEKVCEAKTSAVETKKESSKLNRTQREHSVPVTVEPPTESNLIKRAVTITDVATLENQATAPSKTTVSKVLGLFKKFEPKEKVVKPLEKAQSEIVESSTVDFKNEAAEESADEKPKRPTSLLLNGLGRKTKSVKTTSDSVPNNSNERDEQIVLKKDAETKNIRNSLKLDFSRLPRVKKIVPTDNVIEPQIMNVTSVHKESEKKEVERNGTLENSADAIDTQSRSRSRSRSTVSNSEVKSDHSSETKLRDIVLEENSVLSPRRNPEPTTPEREDIVDRIRRKSFYSRFNEKKQRRKSNLVGPGATEYDPLAVLHGPERSHDAPSSPLSYDLSPGYSVASDLSPSTDRYRSLLTDLPLSTRNNVRYDTYGLNDKVDTYRSLDRNEFRKYPGSRSYLDYDQLPSYGTVSHRYSRTKSLLDNCDGTEETTLSSLRDPLKYNRTISMYSPGNYATYRPKKTRNSAIILKESEKEPSPENILERIRQRKNISISVTRKPDPEKETLPRSTVSPKGEGDGPECSEKVN